MNKKLIKVLTATALSLSTIGAATSFVDAKGVLVVGEVVVAVVQEVLQQVDHLALVSHLVHLALVNHQVRLVVNHLAQQAQVNQHQTQINLVQI